MSDPIERFIGEEVRLTGRHGRWTVRDSFRSSTSGAFVYAVESEKGVVALVRWTDIKQLKVRSAPPTTGPRPIHVDVHPGAPLPTLILDDLHSARTNEELNVVIAAGRLRGWTLNAFGEALGVSRERARQRAGAADAGAAQDRARLYPDSPARRRKEAKTRASADRRRRVNGFKMRDPILRVPVQMLTRLAVASRAATSVRVWTPLDAPERLEIDTYRTLAIQLIEEHGVSTKSIDQALGYQTGTVRAWLARHGYGTLSPSQKAYKGVHISDVAHTQRPAAKRIVLGGHCKRGHLITEDNMVMNGTIGYICGTCRKQRTRAAYEQRRAEKEQNTPPTAAHGHLTHSPQGGD